MGKRTQGKKAKIIQELRTQGHELKHLLKALSMPKSTYYHEIAKVDAVKERDQELLGEIKEIFFHHNGRFHSHRCIMAMKKNSSHSKRFDKR